MNPKKDRLTRVMVIGANPTGIAAVNKLAELGIPVTFVDEEADINQKLSREEYRLNSGTLLNYAHRPGLIRILRNPNIKCLIPAKIQSITPSSQGYSVMMECIPTFVDTERCVLCGKCVTQCPVTLPDGKKAIQMEGRMRLPGRSMIDKRRQPLCQHDCPLHVNAQGYIALTKAQKYQEAMELIRKDNALPGICGRVCTNPCETACRRSEMDEPVAIKDIKRFLSDQERLNPSWIDSSRFMPKDRIVKNQSIAIIGSGPAGLAAAYDLIRFGYFVTIFEKEKKAGGLLRYGIGLHRLPREILDHDIAFLENLGVQIKTNHPISLDQVELLKNQFDGVLLACGIWGDRRLNIQGEDLSGVYSCVSFLMEVHQGNITQFKGKAAVIGDGNSAFDLARTLVRLGADVTLVSWFSKENIPAQHHERVDSEKEGIKICDNTQVVGFVGEKGKLTALTCMKTRPGQADAKGICWPEIIPNTESFEMPVEYAFVSIGQTVNAKDMVTGNIQLSASGLVNSDSSMHTNIDQVYVAGDIALGPTTIVHAMASGRKAASAIHHDLKQAKEPGLSHEEVVDQLFRPDKEFEAIPKDLPYIGRTRMSEISLNSRKTSFSEVLLGFDQAQVQMEANRCLSCGICSECLACVDACGNTCAINHHDVPSLLVEPAGVVIVSDAKQAPFVDTEDIIYPDDPNSPQKYDVYTQLSNGYVAAAQAMMILKEYVQRPKGYGIAFSLPDSGLSPDIRIGVFVCRCKSALGWMNEMDDYVTHLRTLDSVVHAEVMDHMCVHDDTNHMIHTIRQKGITRLVIASCVCCPLNFVCSACTDQRSRLKHMLFHGSGISRSMAEMCNLRGEVLRLIQNNPDLALERFMGLLTRSIHRTKRLKALPVIARQYNFSTAVIGDSEASQASAMTLS
ncbi:MAG: FAD-dependent oxidoreductase, partial [Desulfobacterales bacterium]|nr:FAD-dependent oxidoreductase [Desulfobacterales bacterium]